MHTRRVMSLHPNHLPSFKLNILPIISQNKAINPNIDGGERQAIYAEPGETLELTNTRVLGFRHRTQYTGLHGEGGAIRCQGCDMVKISDSFFKANGASVSLL